LRVQLQGLQKFLPKIPLLKKSKFLTFSGFQVLIPDFFRFSGFFIVFTWFQPQFSDFSWIFHVFHVFQVFPNCGNPAMITIPSFLAWSQQNFKKGFLMLKIGCTTIFSSKCQQWWQ
jgi:hypothetical protein